MKIGLIFLLLSSTALPLYAGGRNFLEPVDGYCSSYDFSHESMTGIRDVLLKGASDAPLARMVRPGAYDPLAGDAVSLVEEPPNGQSPVPVFSVELRTTNVDILPPKQLEGIKVTVRSSVIDKETAMLIAEIFFVATSQTSYRESSGPVPDGSHDIFCSYRVGVGLRAGSTWSPEPKSVLAALASYGYLLHEYVLAPDDKKAAPLSKLNSDGKKLLKRLQKNA